VTLSKEQVRHVAMLARLALEDGEEDFYASQLSGILQHIDRMSELDTESIPATAQVVEIENILRADEPRACLPQEKALENAPAERDGYFIVKAIQEGDPG
jgi:aspartyl-tRNA(Asn)/glutamyl-tRNA(Gln) amidotransferase subunit C